VGEFFFSSPINNYNIWQDYGRSDDDQRHRLVIDGAIHLPSGPANTLLKRFGQGFQLSGSLQYYSALPFNITSGVNTIQGTAGRPIVNGGFIGRNIGIGDNFFGANMRLSRTLLITERLQMQGMVEAFNTFNHRNDLTRNGTFGSGAYPASPSATFGQITAVNDPRSVQLALRFTF
jgi:hypothetical protein